MENVKIRRAKLEDLKDVIPIVAKAWKHAYEGIIDSEFLEKRTNPANFSDGIERWKERFGKLGNEIFLVAEICGEIKGFITGGTARSPSDADKEIVAFYIDPDYHGKGIGRKLYNVFVNIVKEDGAKNIVVGCLRDNKSVGFYKKLGARILKEAFWEYEKGKLPEIFFIFDIN